jgi:hypothetical protein
MAQNTVIIDAATRFLLSNPELLQLASRGAGETGQILEDLLDDVVSRVRSAGEAISEEQVVVGPPHRLHRRAEQRSRSSRPAVNDSRPRLLVITSGDPRGDGQEELLYRSVRKQAAEQ